MTDPGLERLTELAGVEDSYRDAWGDLCLVSPENRVAVLGAMGFDIDSEAGIRDAVQNLEARHWRRLPPVRVIRETEWSVEIPVVVDEELESETWSWILTEENGTSHDGSFIPARFRLLESDTLDGRLVQRRSLELDLRLPLGYHRLVLFAPDDTDQAGVETKLVVVPESCYFPETLEGGGRSWGFAVQLYSLQSQQNWGVGDFGDLCRLLPESSRLGADILGVNPLHALFLTSPERASPYAPSSRLFLNPIYLDVETIPDFENCAPARELASSSRFRDQLEHLRRTDLVDYPGVVALKLPVLELIYEFFRAHHLRPGEESERGVEFRAFQTEGGDALWFHAVYETLVEKFPTQWKTATPWNAWPTGYRKPRSSEVAAFAREHGHRVEFHQYLQWQAELQLAEASRSGEKAGLGVGIFRDLAVGATADGSEAWASPGTLLERMEVGAPPDPWNLKGQKWGFPPPSPLAGQDIAYGPFRDLLRANMRHAGAIRIDHIMGLRRLFCFPVGRPAAEGVYLRYPFEDLLGILALESRRNQCLVVGEDLGTVPEGMRNKLQAAGVLSCRLLYFERDHENAFVRPEDYPPKALVSAATHDLPTMAGFWAGHDLEIKRALDLFRSPEEELEAPHVRQRDKQLLLDAFIREGMLSEDEAAGDPAWSRIVELAYAYLAETPSMLLMVNLEDPLGQEDQVNVPGTPDAEPNWRRKTRVTIEELSRNSLLQEVARHIRERRGS